MFSKLLNIDFLSLLTVLLSPLLDCQLSGFLEDQDVAREPSVIKLLPSMASLISHLEIFWERKLLLALREARTWLPSWSLVSLSLLPLFLISWLRPWSRSSVDPRDSSLMDIPVRLLRVRSLRRPLLHASTSSTLRCQMIPWPRDCSRELRHLEELTTMLRPSRRDLSHSISTLNLSLSTTLPSAAW